jgi:hypothetical protein
LYYVFLYICIQHVRGAWWGGMRKGDHLENLDIDGRIYKKWDGEVWTGLLWMRKWTGGGRL